MRTLSAPMLAALHAQHTDEVALVRIVISHPLIVGGPLRLVNNLENVTGGGNVYTAFPFHITLPDHDDQGATPKVRLVIDNTDQQIVATIRALPPSPPPTIDIEIFLASQPDVIEVRYTGLTLRTVPYDVFTVEGDLLLDEDDLEPYPQYAMTPALFPGLF
jgi:hypothetical protein